MTILRSFFGISCLAATNIHAFSLTSRGRASTMRLASSPVEDEQAISCFIVNAFEVEEEGATPEIICTSKPEEYAWFNGIDEGDMKPTNAVVEGVVECVEGASPRGFPEWECKITGDNAWQ